jgi:hypothetical protein
MGKMQRLRRYAFRFLIILMVLLVAGWLYENRRGAVAWDEAKARAKAAGMSLKRGEYAGPKIPDEENLLLKPEFVKELEMDEETGPRGWGAMLKLGKRFVEGGRPHEGATTGYRDWFNEEITESEARQRVVEASREVEERLTILGKVILETPVHQIFAKGEATGEFFENTEWTTSIVGFTRCFSDSAVLAIRSENGALALDRVRGLCRLSEVSSGSSLISLLVSHAIKKQAMSLVWEGLLLRVWDDAQLEILQGEFSEPKYEERLERVISFEAAWGLEFLTTIEAGDLPEGAEMTEFGSLMNSYYYGGLRGWKDRRRAILVDRALDLQEILRTRDFDRLEKREENSPSPYSPMYAVMSSNVLVSKLLNRGGWIPATNERICRIAMAAEREFLRSGVYPEKTSSMKLDFPIIDLTDPEGRELAYELGPKGRPQIWSRYQKELGEDGENNLRWQFWNAASD